MENKSYSKIIMTVFLIGAFFMILNETLLNIALQELMHYFDISRTTVQWMASGFMMVMGIVSPLSALIYPMVYDKTIIFRATRHFYNRFIRSRFCCEFSDVINRTNDSSNGDWLDDSAYYECDATFI